MRNVVKMTSAVKRLVESTAKRVREYYLIMWTDSKSSLVSRQKRSSRFAAEKDGSVLSLLSAADVDVDIVVVVVYVVVIVVVFYVFVVNVAGSARFDLRFI